MTRPAKIRMSAVATVVVVVWSTAASAADFFWTSGDFVTGGTAPEPLSSGNTLFIQSGGTKRFVGSTFTNQGLVRWQADALQGGNSASVSNSGTWQSESDANSMTWNFGGRPTFTNTGTYSKTSGVVTNVGNWNFVNNGGLISAQAGSIVFNGDANAFNAGSRFSGAGQVRISGPSAFNGMFLADNLVLAGGSHAGTGAILSGGAGLSNGLLGWSGGDLTGNWAISNGATVTASGAATKRQVGSAITNDGTFRWSTTTALQGGNSSSFTNNALTEVTESAAFTWNYGGQHAFVNNATGTVRATNSATLTFGQLALTSNGGLFEAHAGSAMVYGGDSNRFNGGTRFVGDQRMTGTSTFVGQIESDNLRLVGGTQLGGDGSPGSKATLAGAVSWEGGDLQRKWEIKAGATVTASGAATKRQVGSAITNDGTFRWSTTTTLQGGNSSVFTNNGVFDVRADADASWNFGGQAALVNNGLFVKSAGAGETSLSTLALTNNGTIDVRSGSVKLPTNFTNHGTLTGSGSFALGGALTNAGHVAPGASPGTLTISGNYAQSAAGFLDVELNALGNTDLLMVSGTAGLNGTLALHCFGACSFAVGDQFVILDSVGNLTGTFSAMTMSGFATGNFLPIYDTDGDRVLLRVTQNVVAVPEPETYAMLLAGLGLLALAARRQERIAA